MKKMICLLGTFLMMGVAMVGCTSKVFNGPVALSTKSHTARYLEPIIPVTADYTNYMFVIVPIIDDPRDSFDDLMDAASAKGGNALMDVQIRSKFMFLWAMPGIVYDNWEYSGTAARFK